MKTIASSLRRRLTRFECLEPRLVLSGNVTAEVVNGHLHITGDNENNQIAIYGSGEAGTVIIQGGTEDGTGATRTQVNGQNLQTFTDVHRITANMGGGDDRVVVTNLTLNGALHVNLGDGNDRLIVRSNDVGQQDIQFVGDQTLAYGDVEIGGWFIVSGGPGNDVILTNNIVVNGSVHIAGGDGNDYLQMEGQLATHRVGQSVGINMGAGDDVVDLRRMTVERDVNILDRSANTRADVRLRSLQVQQDVRIDTSDAADVVHIQGTADARFTARNLVILTYGGNDRVSVVGATVQVLVIVTGDGDDVVTLVGNRVINTTNVNMGAGSDTLSITNHQSGHLRIQTGFGTGTVNRVRLDRLAISATARIDTGAGEDHITAVDSFFRDLAVFLEEGVDRLSFENVEMDRFQLVNNGGSTA
jgi:hypothetical protein